MHFIFCSAELCGSSFPIKADRKSCKLEGVTCPGQNFFHFGTVVLMALLAISLGGCNQFLPKPFATRATYDAPKSGFRIVIDASGVIAPGADVTDDGVWTAEVSPIGSTNAKTVNIQSAPNTSATVVVDAQDSMSVDWSSRNSESFFRQVLELAGYTNLSDAEIGEAVRAIECAKSGPKATLLPGQTTSLTAVEVNYD